MLSATKRRLDPIVAMACDDSFDSVTISSDMDAVEPFVSDIKEDQPQALTTILQVDKDDHSHHIKKNGFHYLALIDKQVAARAPLAHFISSVTAGLVDNEQTFGLQYWQNNPWYPMQLQPSVLAIMRHVIGKNAMFSKVGPYRALAGPLWQIFSGLNMPFTSVMA